MNLFIDTNILLSFYHLTDEDLEELKKLVPIIQHKKVTLWVTEQLKDEYLRNRDAKIRDALKDFRGPSWGSKSPAFLRDYQGYKAITAILKEAGVQYTSLMKKVEDDLASNNIGADKLIASIFASSQMIPNSDALFNRAILRMRRGNPPGKGSGTIGDEIHWEALLQNVPDGEDLHLVSGDKDYASPSSKEVIHPFMRGEWQKVKHGDAILYPKISSFFATHYPEIKIASEIEKAILIEQLGVSSSFARTHLLISSLSKFDDFTPNEIEGLVACAIRNNQVAAIMSDADLTKFYGRLLEKYPKTMDPLAESALLALLFQ